MPARRPVLVPVRRDPTPRRMGPCRWIFLKRRSGGEMATEAAAQARCGVSGTIPPGPPRPPFRSPRRVRPAPRANAELARNALASPRGPLAGPSAEAHVEESPRLCSSPARVARFRVYPLQSKIQVPPFQFQVYAQ